MSWAGKSERRRRRENPNGTLITGGARFLNCGRFGTSLQFFRDSQANMVWFFVGV